MGYSVKRCVDDECGEVCIVLYPSISSSSFAISTAHKNLSHVPAFFYCVLRPHSPPLRSPIVSSTISINNRDQQLTHRLIACGFLCGVASQGNFVWHRPSARTKYTIHLTPLELGNSDDSWSPTRRPFACRTTKTRNGDGPWSSSWRWSTGHTTRHRDSHDPRSSGGSRRTRGGLTTSPPTRTLDV